MCAGVSIQNFQKMKIYPTVFSFLFFFPNTNNMIRNYCKKGLTSNDKPVTLIQSDSRTGICKQKAKNAFLRSLLLTPHSDATFTYSDFGGKSRTDTFIQNMCRQSTSL